MILNSLFLFCQKPRFECSKCGMLRIIPRRSKEFLRLVNVKRFDGIEKNETTMTEGQFKRSVGVLALRLSVVALFLFIISSSLEVGSIALCSVRIELKMSGWEVSDDDLLGCK